MKTTKKSVLKRKVAKLKLQKNSTLLSFLNEVIAGKKILRPVYSTGSSWKYSTLHDKREEVARTLRTMGIEYESGNDAPRGGKTGAFIKITTKICK